MFANPYVLIIFGYIHHQISLYTFILYTFHLTLRRNVKYFPIFIFILTRSLYLRIHTRYACCHTKANHKIFNILALMSLAVRSRSVRSFEIRRQCFQSAQHQNPTHHSTYTRIVADQQSQRSTPPARPQLTIFHLSHKILFRLCVASSS